MFGSDISGEMPNRQLDIQSEDQEHSLEMTFV